MPRVKKLTNEDIQALAIDPSKMRSYHLGCANCDLDLVVQVPDWQGKGGVRVVCCVCFVPQIVRMPARSSTVACSQCGTETYIRHVEGEG